METSIFTLKKNISQRRGSKIHGNEGTVVSEYASFL
jgi:hypothetical protein